MLWHLVAMSKHIHLCLPNLITQPFNQIPHKNLPHLNLDASHLEPQRSRSKASLRQWQHELRLLKESSTISVNEVKWTILTKCCHCNRMDTRAPPFTFIPNFLLYLLQVRKLQPTIIDGCKLAIAHKLGNSPINVSKDENLIRLLDTFHRDKPKGWRGIPSWNLSLVCHQLTPFEPLKEASLMDLTFKTVFLFFISLYPT